MSIHQVAGHVNSFLAHPDPESSGSSLIKRACAVEHQFYTQLGPTLFYTCPGLSTSSLDLERRNGKEREIISEPQEFMGRWTPEFYGVLRLESKATESNGAQAGIEGAGDAVAQVGEEMIVLENLTYRFRRPNVIDIKLGTRLFDDEAAPQKRLRMTKSAIDTTSAKAGMRITGFQVWDSASACYVKTDKIYGKSLEVAQLPDALGSFFNTRRSASVFNELLLAPTISDRAPLDRELVEFVVANILARVVELQRIMAQLEIRMYGGSILLIYEGDLETLRSTIEREGAEVRKARESRQNGMPQADADDEETGSEDSVSTADSQGNALAHTLLSFDVRLIDFAHTRTAHAKGPDLGVLKGLGTLRMLLATWLESHSE